MKQTPSRILVTGGAGFIGSHIVDRMISEGHYVTVIDNLSSGYLENINSHTNKPQLKFTKADILDYKTVTKLLTNTDAVFHEAALVSVPLSTENPVLANSINATGTLNLLKASVDAGVKRFIYASSAAV